MRTIAIVNQKGGCGKTTTAINLSACLAEKGRSVLLVDLDPQSHATAGVGLGPKETASTMYEVMLGEVGLEKVIREVRPGFDIAPSGILLSAFEQKMAGLPGRESCLLAAFRGLARTYDYILVDCPPSIGLLTFNALRASNEAIVPIEGSFFSLWGVGRLLDMIELVREETSHDIRFKVLCTMYDGRTKFAAEIVEDILEHFEERTYKTLIHNNVKLREAAGHGVPVTEYDPLSRGTREYRALAAEVIAEEDEVKVEEALQVGLPTPQKETYGPRPVPGGILFTVDAPGAASVGLAGDFNDWGEPIRMNDDDEDGIWVAIASLDPGVYQYKFVIDGQWKSDPENPVSVDDSHSGTNSIVVVK
ncbi:MAG TPA: AAA family ATPase [bacterium]|nr:AAA family ATPase [bacterium]